jgi:ferredoxin
MITLTIDGKPVTVAEGSTILDAARALGITIPTLCYLAGVKDNHPACMVCVVRITGQWNLQPACATKVRDGMIVASETAEVKAARKAALELLLSDHLGDCVSVCQRVCPARMEIPEVIRLVSAGKTKEAIALVKEDVVFPGVLGRICRAPCEMGCRRRQFDGAVAIQLIEREVANLDANATDRFVPTCAPPTGKRIAIVGAGPTGLSAAFFLLKLGHKVTVYDASAEPGGQMRTADVPREVVDADIATIGAIGLEFRGNTRLGSDLKLDDLRRDFNAVILAVGPTAKTNHTELGVTATEKMVKVNAKDFQTEVPGVFAGGSCIRSGWDPARSVGDGHLLAESVDAFLAGRPYQISPKEFTTTIPKLSSDEYRQLGKGANSELSVRELISEAEKAAGRCCHCDCRAAADCKLRLYAVAYNADPKRFAGERRRSFEVIRQPGGVIFEPGKCISCGICVAIAEQAKEPLGLAFIGRGFEVKVTVPLNGSLTDALQKVGADCVKHCPTGALAFERES